MLPVFPHFPCIPAFSLYSRTLPVFAPVPAARPRSLGAGSGERVRPWGQSQPCSSRASRTQRERAKVTAPPRRRHAPPPPCPAAAVSSVRAELHQEQKPEQSPDLLPLVLDPLEHAWLLTVAEGDADSIIKLLDLDPSLLTRRDFVTGFTALHWLAKHGHHESFIQVISHAQKKGYPVNMNIPTASGGLTPLHLAALQGHEVLIKVLVGAYGADTTCRDHNGRKAWQYLPADTSRDLKELAGALEEDLVQLHSHNTNNNCKSSREPGAGQDCVDSGAEGKAQHSWGLSTLRGFVRQAFAFFHER
uniref:Uncharacterized protein n=1 Tax=Geospiza parvula TaxID=87175 RepID=A0A8C3NG25_GEOPR